METKIKKEDKEQTQQMNPFGIAGFILVVCGLFLLGIPYVGRLIYILGLIFSIIGLFKKQRGYSVAGILISIIAFILFPYFIRIIFYL